MQRGPGRPHTRAPCGFGAEPGSPGLRLSACCGPDVPSELKASFHYEGPQRVGTASPRGDRPTAWLPGAFKESICSAGTHRPFGFTSRFEGRGTCTGLSEPEQSLHRVGRNGPFTTLGRLPVTEGQHHRSPALRGLLGPDTGEGAGRHPGHAGSGCTGHSPLGESLLPPTCLRVEDRQPVGPAAWGAGWPSRSRCGAVLRAFPHPHPARAGVSSWGTCARHTGASRRARRLLCVLSLGCSPLTSGTGAPRSFRSRAHTCPCWLHPVRAAGRRDVNGWGWKGHAGAPDATHRGPGQTRGRGKDEPGVGAGGPGAHQGVC